ncbi:MAG: AAA family ATPase [Planctomycetota bacterium]|nr:AAA family ATPase [Planctomycetota bacterium]
MSSRKDCEEAIVSFGWIAPDAFLECCESINADDFLDKQTKDAFLALVAIGDSIATKDTNAVVIELRDRFGLDTGFMVELSRKGYFATNAGFYATRLKQYSRIAKLRLAASKLLANTELVDDLGIPNPDEALAKFEVETRTVVDVRSQTRSLGDAAREAIRLQREAKATGIRQGMSTGYDELDLACGGFFRGQFVLLSGRSYRGKTTFALNLAYGLANKGSRVLMFCLEMKDWELAERMLAAFAPVDLSQFTNNDMTDKELDQADRAATNFDALPMWLHDSVSETVNTIKAKVRYHKSKFGLDVLFVDHLQRLDRHDYKSEYRHHLKEVCKTLKSVARDLDIAIVLLSQLRMDEDESEPNDASYSESKQIVEEADIAMMLHRKKNDNTMKLILNKVRKGQATEVYFDFHGARQRYTEQPRDEKPSQLANQSVYGYRNDFDNYHPANAPANGGTQRGSIQ